MKQVLNRLMNPYWKHHETVRAIITYTIAAAIFTAILWLAPALAQTVSVPAFVQLDPDVSAAVTQYPEAVLPALNTTALAVQAELAALGSTTDIAEEAALSVRAAAKQQACNNLQVVMAEAQVPQDSSAWKDLAFLEELRISEPEQLLSVSPEGRGLWIYYVEPSPQTGNAYWYTREFWEVVRTRYTATDRVERKRKEHMTASYVMSVEEMKTSTMWTPE